jgi:hypothetical protein
MAKRKVKLGFLTFQNVLAVAGLILGVAGFAGSLVKDEFPLWLTVASVVLLSACLLFLIWDWLRPPAGIAHAVLVSANPWLVFVVLIQTAVILILVWPVSHTSSLIFDDGTSAVYNSYLHERKHSRFLQAVGADKSMAWNISDKGRTGYFSYHTNANESPDAISSSGGYISFYRNPCDRLTYRSIRFRCKAEKAVGIADMGVRLVVDDPKGAAGSRELIVYKIDSLTKYGKLSEKWATFDIPIGDFTQEEYRPPFPRGLDENTINKVVFFITHEMAAKCPSA